VRRRELLLYGTVPALLKVPPPFFRRHPIEAEVVLTGLDRPSELISRLLDGGHTVIAGRLAGALRRVGRRDIAQEIIDAMRSAGYDVREADPFADAGTVTPLQTPAAPIAGRLQALWHSSRGPILRAFSDTPKPRLDAKTYLRRVDEVYESDAYHSLSIEGYVVTPELIERVRAGDWQPDERDADRKSRDALAARGYWEAFQLVKESVRQILAGESAAELIREAHRHWYRALFQPSVRVGLIPASALAGYRNDAVFIRGSRHVPPRREAVPEAMSALFDLLEGESEPAVRAVLAHWLIGYIHPYPDGNGRMARFAMNAMLASGGYPWTVIRVEDRDDYLQALERASVDNDITPFATFIAACVRSFEHAVGSL
jgi:Fic family protein